MKSLRNAARILLEVMREIFDESSYARFLRREQMQSSPQAYAAFWRHRERSHARHPRCC